MLSNYLDIHSNQAHWISILPLLLDASLQFKVLDITGPILFLNTIESLHNDVEDCHLCAQLSILHCVDHFVTVLYAVLQNDDVVHHDDDLNASAVHLSVIRHLCDDGDGDALHVDAGVDHRADHHANDDDDLRVDVIHHPHGDDDLIADHRANDDDGHLANAIHHQHGDGGLIASHHVDANGVHAPLHYHDEINGVHHFPHFHDDHANENDHPKLVGD